VTPTELDELGLGLDYGTVRLVRARAEWRPAADRLLEDVSAALADDLADVAHIGSTAVTGMLAKPIIDTGVLLAEQADADDVIGVLASIGYVYRGDAGDDGGLVFVLDVRPWVRVAHLHAIAHGDPQWDRYLRLVELLRNDPTARAAYEKVKHSLASSHPDGRQAYTSGKSDVVRRVLGEA